MSEKSCSNTSCDKTSCEGCPSKAKEQQPQSLQAECNEYSCVRRVIGVVSGKGGVGKSMVTASLANELAAKGYQVGILDADITGPSIPRMYGVHGPAEGSDMGIEPRLTKNGIKLMSMNLLLPTEDTPVIWRGPIIANIVKQFWTDVIWGDLDYLLVDMPPGTGDVPLTVFQLSLIHIFEIKEVRLSPNIEENDLNTKVGAAKKFIQKGDKVKVTLRFRGREMAHVQKTKQILDVFAEKMADVAVVEKAPKMEGRQMMMFLAEKRQ